MSLSIPHSNFSWFSSDFSIAGCLGRGLAEVNQDIRDVFQTKFSATLDTNISYVSPYGSDSDDGSNWAHSFLTASHSVRNGNSGTTALFPGVYDPSDFRYTDTGGNKPKKIIAPFGGVTLQHLGDNLSSVTWTANGTYGNVWQTTLSTANVPLRVLITTILDQYGKPQPLPIYSSLVDVSSSSFGWYYNSSTKILYVRIQSNNIESYKSNLKAIYGDSSGDMRTLLYGTVSYWENINFNGYISLLNASGQTTPQFWGKNCTFNYGNTHSLLNEGGYSYIQGCTAYRQAADGANYNTTNSVVAHGLEVNFNSYMAGDIDTYGAAQTLNPQGTSPAKNASSNHDSYVIRVNGNYSDCFGPNIADTSTSYSWNLGCYAGYNVLPANSIPSTPRYGILNQANTSWSHGCVSTRQDGGFNSDSSATSYQYNCLGTNYATNSGTFSTYTP